MYHFAVVALIGLVTLKVVDLLVELAPGLGRIPTLVTFGVGVLATSALGYSMFDGFAVPVREAWIGTVATGLVVGALAGAWQAVLTRLGSTATDGSERRSGRPRIAA
ncbi:MAG: hypothetical protein ACRD0Q_11915 [Acidimicrobiales bacterium]